MNHNRHAPNRFRSYQEIHNTVLNQFIARDFVQESTLEFKPYPMSFHLVGEIGCLGEIIIAVDKLLYIVDHSNEDYIVQTVSYSYNASVRGYGNIIRYDNQDGDYLRPGHLDAHHKHSFDWRNNTELPCSPIWVGEDDWPTLQDVLEEVLNWYWQHRDELPSPDSYPVLGLGFRGENRLFDKPRDLS